MLIHLPVETWIEILDWLDRRDLVKKLDQLWDREFTPIVQDWLHKYTRNVCIGKLWADLKNSELRPIANVDMPENVTSFARIKIRYLDFTSLALLRRMRRLFHNICLDIYSGPFNDAKLSTQSALRLLMPMISNSSPIEAISLCSKILPFFSTNYSTAFFNTKLLCIRDHKSVVVSDTLINWLFTRREDGQPRVLLTDKREDDGDFCEKLRERFLDSARHCACPFFVLFCFDILPNEEAVTTDENVRTGELLTAKSVKRGTRDYGLITNCCPMDADSELLAKKTAEVLDWSHHRQQQTIALFYTQIGHLNAEDALCEKLNSKF